MTECFSSGSVYASLAGAPLLDEVMAGIRSNQHFGFEFFPGEDEKGFSDVLQERLRREPVFFLCLDLEMVTGVESLCKLISRGATAAFSGNLKKIESTLRKLIPTAKTRIVMGETETPYIDFDYGTDITRLLGNLLDAPEMIGMEEETRSIVFITGAERLEEILREDGMRVFLNKARGHAITSYIMIGRAVEDIAAKLGGGMRNQVRVIPSSEIMDGMAVEDFVRSEFSAAGMDVPENVLKEIFRISDGRIGFISLLGRELGRGGLAQWGRFNMDILVNAVGRIVRNSWFAYSSLWDLLNNRQKALVSGLGREEGTSLYTSSFISKYGFGTATNLQAALRGLHSKGIIIKKDGRWTFADPFFREWIRWSSGMGFSVES